MSRNSISSLRGLQILDSRGVPTLSVTVTLANGVGGSASVPSGASTGLHEAVELRDGDPSRFGGKGVLTAIGHVEGEIAGALQGLDPGDQAFVDQVLVDLDGTENKSGLGGNAILGVSMAVARAAAADRDVPLYRYLGGPDANLLPMPCMNVLNGGKHADNSLDFQEFMLVPVGAPSFAEAMRYGSETYHALKAILLERGLSTGVGDEGGFAPDLASNEAACELIVEASRAAGFEPGRDIAIALDPAASSFENNGRYELTGAGGGTFDRAALLALYGQWIDRYPIVSIEDGFAEDDWQGFSEQTRKQGDRIQIVGDDVFVTNPSFIERGIAAGAANAALIKLNQIGTVTEAITAVEMCHRAGWATMVSHRSGETIDDFIADFAVAMGSGQMKSGAPCRGERLAKYNRLLAIERELGGRARFDNPFVKQTGS
ncbi:phosphopyruvate hydratase [Sphingopyxis chilensis]